jgi:hypothetical protein
METAAGLVLGFIGVVGCFAIPPVAIVLHHRSERRKRELEHIERMRALELGRTLPQDEPWWSPLRIALLIGAGVPSVAFLSAGLTTLAAGYHESMWIAVGMTGISSVICGSILAGQSLNRQKTSEPLDAPKPYVDEDAYDVVSARG